MRPSLYCIQYKGGMPKTRLARDGYITPPEDVSTLVGDPHAGGATMDHATFEAQDSSFLATKKARLRNCVDVGHLYRI